MVLDAPKNGEFLAVYKMGECVMANHYYYDKDGKLFFKTHANHPDDDYDMSNIVNMFEDGNYVFFQ